MLAPTLSILKVSDTTATYTWVASPDYCYAIVDEHDHVLVRLPYGSHQYTETHLKPNTTYLRKLAAYNNEESSPYSELISVCTKTSFEAMKTIPFEPLVIQEQGRVAEEVIHENLAAFQSGVGHGLDLKVEKQSRDVFQETFGLTVKAEGVYEQKTKRYTQIPFNYRVKTQAKYQKETTEGFVTFQTTAHDKATVSFDVFRYATSKVNIRARVRFNVEYYKKSFDSIATHRKTLYTRELSIDLDQKDKVAYDPIAGNIYLKPSDVLLSDLTIGEMIQEAINGDAEISSYAKIIPYHVYGILLEDDYPYLNEEGYRWRSSATREFSPSGNGTINAMMTNPNDVENSKIKLVGYARAGLFTGYQHVEKNIDSYERYTVAAYTNAELKNIPIKNVDDLNYSFQFALSEILTDIQRLELKADRADRIQVTCQIPDSVSNEPVVIVQFSESIRSEIVTYTYTDDSFSTMLSYYRHVAGITPNAENEYLFTSEIIDCSHNVTFNGQVIKKGMTFKEVKTPIDTIEIITTPYTKVCDFEMTLPSVESDQPLTGIVNNGDAAINGGKKDYVAYVPKFPYPTGILEDTIVYQVIFESFNEYGVMVRAEFDGTGPFGNVNRSSNTITFSSDAFTYVNLPFKNTVFEETFSNLNIEGLSETSYPLTLKRSLTDLDMNYDTFTLTATTNNNDVLVTDCPEMITFDEEGVCVTSVACRIQQNATSKWSPRLHSGHYYINQHEYFLPSSFDSSAVYSENNTFVETELEVNARALVKQSMPITRVTEKWDMPSDYGNILDESQKVHYYLLMNEEGETNHWLEIKPTIDTNYYRKFDNRTYLLPAKILNDVMDVYGQLRFNEEKSKNVTTTYYARALDLETNTWSNWVPVQKGYALEGLPSSNAVQIKVDCAFTQEETLETITDIYACSYDFESIMDKAASSNINMVFDTLMGDNPTKEAIFVTKVIDRGTVAASNFRGLSSNEGTIEYYMATSNHEETLLTNPTWRHCGGDSFVEDERFIRYKIIIPPHEEVYSFKTETKVTILSDVFLRFGDFSLEGRKEGAFRYKECYGKKIYPRLKDGKVTTLETNIKGVLESLISDTDYTFEEIYEFYFTSNSPDFELQYDPNNKETTLLSRSLTLQVHELEIPKIKLTNNQVTLNGLPEQFSPIIVEHETYGPLKEVETFTGEFGVFTATFDLLRGQTTITCFTEEALDEVMISYETNQETNYKTLHHLSLNPIYQTKQEGFIYLSYEKPTPTTLVAHANPTTFLPYQDDFTTIYVQVLDKDQNPVMGQYVEVFETVGDLECENFVSDECGMVLFRYHSPRGVGSEKVQFKLQSNEDVTTSITMTVTSSIG